MSIPGIEGLASELSPGWRRAGYAALAAGFIVFAYFIFVDGRIAHAQEGMERNSKRVDAVQGDIKEIKGAISDIQFHAASRDQKLDDMKEQMNAMNDKLDRLLMQGQRRASVYP